MVEFAALGDLHVDSTLLVGLFQEAAYSYQVKAVNDALEQARDAGLDRVVFLGDVFHRPRPSVRGLVAMLDVLAQWRSQFEFHFITGNHDVGAADQPHSLHTIQQLAQWDLIGDVHVHDQAEEKVWGGVPVRFLPWPHRTAEGSSKVCMAHLARPGAVRDNGFVIRERSGTDVAEVESDSRNTLWVSGHLHTAQKVGSTYFPGTLYQTNFGERDGAKSWLRVKARMRKGRLEAKTERVEAERPFRLATVQATKSRDWATLDLDNESPSIRYRVVHRPGLKPPPQFAADNPNAVHIVAGKLDKAGRLKVSGVTDERQYADDPAEALHIDPSQGLNTLLRKWGVSPRDRIRAHAMVKQAVADTAPTEGILA